jgi:acetolactate synthase I/III small subunit
VVLVVAILVAPRLPGYPIRFPFWSLWSMRHVLSAVVQNVPGVLAHVSGMLASRGYNIDSLAVGETEDPNLSRMTFVVVGDDRVLDQVRKQLEKIVTVVQVDDVSSRDHVERDLMLLKVAASPGSKRTEVRELVEIFRARVVDVGPEELMIEISGRESKIEAFIQRMRPYGILELVRTGRIAMVRGTHRQPKTEEEAEELDDNLKKLVS